MNEIENIKPPPLPKMKSKDLNRKWLVIIVGSCLLFLVGLVSFVLVRVFIIQPYRISSGAMQPTLLIGDQIICNKAFGAEDINRGDIIVFRLPQDRSKVFVFRVVALPGETVESKQNNLFIDGVYFKEDYIKIDNENIDERRGNFGFFTVSDNSFFVLGDNRNNSYDSRYWGFVDYTDVIGKITHIYWSRDKESSKIRWERVGMTVK